MVRQGRQGVAALGIRPGGQRSRSILRSEGSEIGRSESQARGYPGDGQHRTGICALLPWRRSRDDSPRPTSAGASGMTRPCRPTAIVRFVQHARDKAQSNSCLAWHTERWDASAFDLRERFTYKRPSTIELFVYKRTIEVFFLGRREAEMHKRSCLPAARLSSPRMYAGALRRDLVKLISR
jgi:hypothetical protein